jgi:hypothetical protein
MSYPSAEAVERASKQMREPGYFFRRMTWGERYSYICEWHALHCGTTTRYHWLVSRCRFPADAEAHLH